MISLSCPNEMLTVSGANAVAIGTSIESVRRWWLNSTIVSIERVVAKLRWVDDREGDEEGIRELHRLKEKDTY